MSRPDYPSLYQINTRAHLYERSRELGRPATLADISDATLDRIAAHGFDWVWPLGIWQTGPASLAISRSHPGLREVFLRTLPDFVEDDVCGSPFAIRDYDVHTDFGGRDALLRFREKLAKRGMRLLLDFVPNHTALDHDWVHTRPEYYVGGTESHLEREPHNFRRMETGRGPMVLAHGRDPYFPGWTDT